MPYAIVQAIGAENNNSAQTTVASGNLTSTAGNSNIVVVYYEGATTSVTLSDTQGNNYTERGTELADSGAVRRMRVFDDLSIAAGTNSVTATLGAARDFPAIYVVEVSGISAFDVQSKNSQETPGTGANAVTSGNAANNTQPALHFGFTFNTNLGTAPSVGTGFTLTSPNPSWDYGLTDTARGEHRRLTSTGTQAATFTATENQRHMTIQAIYTEIGAGGVDTGGIPSPVLKFIMP